jgi:DNA-binding CsgD family transcriptional regulator/tetratricopeptide (TPR) repeat protein
MHPLAPEQERFRLYEAMAAFLAAIAAPCPLIILLDDLQWVDAATCDLLVHIAGRTRSAALLIAGAYREGEAADNPALARALGELNRHRRSVTLELRPLESEEGQTLATHLLGGAAAPDVVRLLHDQSEGNPFFLEELIRALVEDGTLAWRGEQWELAGQPESALPPRVAEAIRLRLGRLDPAVVDLLRVAAVVGRTVEPWLLSRLAEMETEQAEDLLLAAARAHLLQPDAGGMYAFTHDMVRETLYAEVGRERRRRLHQAIGEALAAQPGPRSPRWLADLAFHFAESGERARGVSYALAAGEAALRASAAGDAMAHFRTALRLLGDGEHDRRAAALTGLGDAAALAGDYPQAGGACAAAVDAFLLGGNLNGAAGASRRLGRVRWRQEVGSEAVEAFQRALELLGPEDSAEAAEVLLQLADLYVTGLGRYAEGIAHAERALAMIERLGERRLEARALCVMGNIKARGNDLSAGQAALARSLGLAQELDDPALGAEACAYLANVSAWIGNLARSRELSLQRLALAERTHDPFELRHVYSWIGAMDMLQGRWPEAERWFARQERALEGLQSPEPFAVLRASQGTMHYYRGRFEEAERALLAAVNAIRPMGAGQLIWYLGWLGLVLVELRPREEALACFAELHELAGRLDEHSSARLAAFAYLAVGYARAGEHDRAAGCYEHLLPFRGQLAPVPADRALGLAAAAGGDYEAARKHLADAERQMRASDVRPELALILLERGRLERDRPRGDGARSAPPAARSNDLIAEGLDLCAELGMQALGRRILGPAPVEPHGRVAGLTERELEVLRLVAQGRTNREIARELFLSEHTVARHLTHIFTKVGVENRAGAAAYALRHNVV